MINWFKEDYGNKYTCKVGFGIAKIKVMKDIIYHSGRATWQVQYGHSWINGESESLEQAKKDAINALKNALRRILDAL